MSQVEDANALQALLQKRNLSFDFETYQNLKEKDKALLQGMQVEQEKRNKLSKEIGRKKGMGEDAADLLRAVQGIKEKLEQLKLEKETIHAQLQTLQDEIPNELDPAVPTGKDENDNEIIEHWGEPPTFSFPIKDHIEIGQKLLGLDFEKAAQMSRSRFVVMRGAIASLHRALANFMLDIQVEEHGYEEINPPLLINQEALYGACQWPKFQEELFFMKDENLGLIPTSEVSLVNLVQDTLIDANELPYRWVSFTPCFRREAGSYGRDTKGMIRQHQFEKVELVQVVAASEAETAHQAMVQHSQTILQRLELPYRKALLCSGDTGFHSRKTYDLEVWLPSQNTYREIASISQCGDFQAKRLNARAKDPKTNERIAVHTLNGSALAVGRTLIAFLENHQKEDGTLHLPAALLPYLSKQTQMALSQT